MTIMSQGQERTSATPSADAQPEQRRRRDAGDAIAERNVAQTNALVRGGGGAPLPEATRAKMESSFGADFSSVRVHEGAEASAAGGVAYATGEDLHFAPGRYQPGTSAGDELIGHELTHVVQQRAGGARVQAKGGIDGNSSLEAEADTLGAKAARGEKVSVTGSTSSGAVQLKRYAPGERIQFTHPGKHKGKQFSGIVIKVNTDSKVDDQVAYEVDANLDGDQQSLIIQGGIVTREESPPMPKGVDQEVTQLLDDSVEQEVRQILGMNVRVATANGPGVEPGDVLVGDRIVIKAPPAVQKQEEGTALARAKEGFLRNVVRDLVVMAKTKSGRSLLTSINEAATSNKKLVFIAFTAGASNAGQINGSGEWDSGTQQPGGPASVSIGYNPVNGLPIQEQPHQVHDETIFPALEDEFGRPKNKPSDVTLFHELVHGDDMLRGRLYTKEVPSGKFDKSKVSEMHAVGLEEYFDKDFIEGKSNTPTIYSENTYRHERGVALRPWYKDQDETLPAPEEERSELEDEDDEPLEAEPKPKSWWHLPKEKRNRRDQIARVKRENDQRRQRNDQRKIARDKRDTRENRQALVDETRRTNIDVQKRARLDELDKKKEDVGEKQVAKLEKQDEHEAEPKQSKAKAPAKKPVRVELEPPAPRQIGGKPVQNVSGDGMDCLIRALLTAVGANLKHTFGARDYLVKNNVVARNEMLELAGASGDMLIAYLRSQHLIDSDRGVRVHYFQGGELVHQDVAGGGNPIEVFLSLRERHFYAVVG